MPSTTPPSSSIARRRRCPSVTPRQITAAIEAKAGRSLGSSSVASHHAASAATAVCRIAGTCGRSRRRAAVVIELGALRVRLRICSTYRG